MSGLPPALDLLTWAVGVADRSVRVAGDADPAGPTPCSEWNLATLVRHVADSAATVRQLLDGTPPGPPPPAGCAAARRALHGLRLAIPHDGPAAGVVALLGAYELTVHAWDLDQATGYPGPLPPELVAALLAYSPQVLDGIDRTGLFAAEVPPAEAGSDTDRLLALFGRRRWRYPRG